MPPSTHDDDSTQPPDVGHTEGGFARDYAPILKFLIDRINETEQPTSITRGHREWCTDQQSLYPHLDQYCDFCDGLLYTAQIANPNERVGRLMHVMVLEIVSLAGVAASKICGHYADDVMAGRCDIFPPETITGLRVLASYFSDHPDFQEDWKFDF